MWLSKFRMSMISSQNYSGSNRKSYKIIRIKIFATWSKEKPSTWRNARGLNMAAVKLMNVNP
jgi:hypothetical protein